MSTSTSDGSVATGGTTGYTIAQLLTLLANATDKDSTALADYTRIYQALTEAGRAVSTIDGTVWWWLRATGDFETTASTASYTLRTINSAAMADLYAIERIYYDDDWVLAPMTYRDYQAWYRVDRPTAGTTQPTAYMLTGDGPICWMKDIPDDTYTIYVDYVKRHLAVNGSAADSVLIVPGEYQHGVYYSGALWLLRHDIADTASLRECGPFMEAIERMHAASPISYDDDPTDNHRDSRPGYLPHDRKVVPLPDGGYLTMNPVSL